MLNDPHQAYLESRILTASPVELIRMLYRGAIAEVECARGCLREGDIRGRTRAINHTIEILCELACSLDFVGGGGIAINLLQLYDYIQRRLLDAQFQQSEPPLEEVAKLLGTLLSAWQEVGLSHESLEPAPALRYAEPPATLCEPGAESTTSGALDQLY